MDNRTEIVEFGVTTLMESFGADRERATEAINAILEYVLREGGLV